MSSPPSSDLLSSRAYRDVQYDGAQLPPRSSLATGRKNILFPINIDSSPSHARSIAPPPPEPLGGGVVAVMFSD